MSVYNIVKSLDRISSSVFNTVVLLGLGLVAFGAVAQSIPV